MANRDELNYLRKVKIEKGFFDIIRSRITTSMKVKEIRRKMFGSDYF